MTATIGNAFAIEAEVFFAVLAALFFADGGVAFFFVVAGAGGAFELFDAVVGFLGVDDFIRLSLCNLVPTQESSVYYKLIPADYSVE